MSAHTPGPWEVWVGHDEVWAGVSENSRVSIAGRCRVATAEDEDEEIGAAEKAANLRLIAAAPAMLDALKRAEGWVIGSSGHRGADECDCERCETVREVRAAIAKAEGK